jgi:S-adenosylmethionine:tRNA ribosyltransferase-isomerase
VHLSDFDYDLPTDLIATEPLAERSDSRLLFLSQMATLADHTMMDLVQLLNPGDLLVFNDTSVIKARLQAVKPSGGKCEVLVERISEDPCTARCYVRSNKTPKTGDALLFGDGFLETQRASCKVLGREEQLFVLKFSEPVLELLERLGEIPLPPYFKRAPTDDDLTRYQSLLRDPAKKASAAAPTASLHFDEKLLKALEDRGVNLAKVTLHVGSGTFAPVKTEDLSLHVMHAEYGELSAQAAEQIRSTKAAGGRVIAVGTTVTRTLESAYQVHGELAAWRGDTSIFITPGYEFKVIDALITNFHLPKSTLIMLVSALAGRETVLSAYEHAINECYRFFSYGDAMLIEKAKSASGS